MSSLNQHLNLRAFLAGLFLALIGALCLSLIIIAQNDTKDLIAKNRRAQEAELISALLPPERFGDNLDLECRLVSDPRVGQNMKLFAASKAGELKGYILQYSTARGYSNPLILVASFSADKSLYKADLQFSRETPGIGDKVDRRHGSFLDQLSGRTLFNANWDVKKFNGDFDYITGATVTSRAVILASRDALAVLNESDFAALPKCGTRGQ